MITVVKLRQVLDRIFKSVLRLSLALFIAIIPVVWVIQNDPKIQNFAKNKLIEILQKEWKAKIEIESSDINLFTGTIVLKNGIIKNFDVDTNLTPNCWWRFEKASVKFSRLDCFIERRLVLQLHFYNVCGQTDFKSKDLCLIDHLKNIFVPSSEIEANLTKIEIDNIKLRVENKNNFNKIHFVDFDIPGSLSVYKQKLVKDEFRWQGFLDIKNGSIVVDQRNFLENISGRSKFFQEIDYHWVINIDQNCSSFLFSLDDKCNIGGSIENGKVDFVLKDQKKLIDLSVTATSDYKLKCKGYASIEIVQKTYNFLNPDKQNDFNLTGNCNFVINADFVKEPTSSGKINFDHLKWNDVLLGAADVSFIQNSEKIDGNFCVDMMSKNFLGQDIKLGGEGVFNFKNWCGKFFLKNMSQVNLLRNYISINPDRFQAVLNIDKNLDVLGKYKISITNANPDLNSEQNKNYNMQGDCFLKNKNLDISGKLKEAEYFFQGVFKPKFYLTKLGYQEKGKKIVQIEGDCTKPNIPLQGQVQYAFLKSYLPLEIRRNILGKAAVVSFSLDQDHYDRLKGQVSLSGGQISFLGMYNPIKKVNFDFDANFISKEFLFNNLEINFFKGKISSPRASVYLRNDFSVDFVHMPLQLDDFLINVKKYFYGIVYGNLILMKNPFADKPEEAYFKIFGDLVLKRSLFKENIFVKQGLDSSFVDFIPTESIASSDQVVQFDINLSSEKPMSIKTSFVQSNAFLELNLRSLYFNNKLQIPKVAGSIDLEKGSLDFLYNKLFINYGKIQFLPTQNTDPMIDLVAQNRIKKYLISLQVSGSLQNPNIVLESSPELSEEQILSLLFAGSENVSFQADLPTIFMQNLNKLIMGSKDILPKNSAFFKKLTLPLKYIQITPDFTNPMGYGGIKGTVSVDLSNQIHAQIQKNFNLQEDFAFQVEYFLTDDINLKVVRDQSGEIGSEVEVRLKF